MDDTADALWQRCGSFGSAQYVVGFKAIGQVRKDEADLDKRNRLLGESLQLF